MSSFPALTGAEIRSRFLEFFEKRSHKILPSASLVPEDPTVLLTIAGMLPFKPIFLGQKEPEVPRATTAQKCVRTNDIENVGRTARHHTFFEMLGNFSFGDYFKKEAIAWGWELVTQVYQLPPEQLVVSVFHSDDEAFAIWRDLIGIPAHRIQRMGEDNFWASGATGPCGPCSEIYYDFKPEEGDAKIDLEDDSRFLEIYNLVFMELNRDANGDLTPLKKQNIDTGLGLERMAQILQRVPNNYETDLIFPIIKKAADIAGIDYHKSDEETKTSLKVIGDHIRAAVHMIADGITVSNGGRGYVLRRLIRRIIYHGRLIGIDRWFTKDIADKAITLSESIYPNVRQNAYQIENDLQNEEIRFLDTLERGEKLLKEILIREQTQISGKDAFTLSDTYGFPLELTQEIAAKRGLSIDIKGFEAAMDQQRRRSQEAHKVIDLTAQEIPTNLTDILPTDFVGYESLSSRSTVRAIYQKGQQVPAISAAEAAWIVLDKTPFYAESGGQESDSGELNKKGSDEELEVKINGVQKSDSGHIWHLGKVFRGILSVGDIVNADVKVSERRRIQAHHTATHLLQAALKKIVDANVSQAGSLVASDRLRFDFNLARAVTADELKQVETQINNWIAEAHDSQIAVMPIAEAKAKGAIAMFGEKYGAEVRVMDIPNVSMELCGGTHVRNTSEIGLFKIMSEAGVASGVRRIEAVAGQAVIGYLNLRDEVTKDLSDRFKIKPEEIPDRITGLQNDLKNAQKEIEKLKQELAITKAESLITQAEAIGNFKMLVANLEGVDAESLKTAAEKLLDQLGNGAVVLGSVPEAGKVSLVAAFSKEVNKQGLQAGKFIGAIAKICGGGGGGRPNLAQAGGKDTDKLPEALETAKTQLKASLA